MPATATSVLTAAKLDQTMPALGFLNQAPEQKRLPAKLAAFKATHPEMQPVARLSRAWFGPSSTLAALLVSGLRFGNDLCDAARRLWRLYYYDIRTWLSGTWQRHRRAVEEP